MFPEPDLGDRLVEAMINAFIFAGLLALVSDVHFWPTFLFMTLGGFWGGGREYTRLKKESQHGESP